MPDGFAAIRSTREARAKAVQKQWAAQRRAERRFSHTKDMVIVVLAAGFGLMAYDHHTLAQKVNTRPVVYTVMQPNGEFVSSTHYDEVTPTGKRETDIHNALWTYVQARDCYGSTAFVRQANIAQAMSDDRVGQQVKIAFALSNPLAPQHVYGEHNITVQCELADPPTPVGNDGDTYMFRFHRAEDNGRMSLSDWQAAPIYTVTVRYRTGVYHEDDKRFAWLERETFNAPGVQVFDYPGAKPENAKPLNHPVRTSDNVK